MGVFASRRQLVARPAEWPEPPLAELWLPPKPPVRVKLDHCIFPEMMPAIVAVEAMFASLNVDVECTLGFYIFEVKGSREDCERIALYVNALPKEHVIREGLMRFYWES
jgi:hypothetical protein